MNELKQSALEKLQKYRMTKAKAWTLCVGDVKLFAELPAATQAELTAWSVDASEDSKVTAEGGTVFITVSNAVAFYRALTAKARCDLIMAEALGGFFDGDSSFDDGLAYCSTPCVDWSLGDAAPSVDEFEEALSDCAVGGVLFLY